MYTKQELCIHLLESGCGCTSGKYTSEAYLDGDETFIEFSFPLSSLDDINITYDKGVLESNFNGKSGKLVLLPTPKFGKRLSFYGYLKSLLKKPIPVELVRTLEQWVTLYKYGYTYANFRKAVFNNTTAAYSFVLNHNMDDLASVQEVSCHSIQLIFMKDSMVIYVFSSNAILAKNNLNLLDFLQCDNVEDFLSNFTGNNDIAVYRRKKVIDTMVE